MEPSRSHVRTDLTTSTKRVTKSPPLTRLRLLANSNVDTLDCGCQAKNHVVVPESEAHQTEHVVGQVGISLPSRRYTGTSLANAPTLIELRTTYWHRQCVGHDESRPFKTERSTCS